ncbi:peptide ABC transporter substrate-binding protein [Bartonella sp. DGB1]|uniref:peptide ABC transporter substrate-binding protein n=1 Tax=Bartonella sp. DGB1 TaxID=3239807 RepID=UPI0035233793
MIQRHKMVIDNLFEKLIERDLEGKITAGVAVSWKNKDNKIWTFKLRKNAKWSDGKPVTAHDFVYAIRRTVDPKVASPLAGRYMTIGYKNAVEIVNGNISVKELGVKAIDDYTLEITLEKPVPYFIEIAGIAPLRKDVVEKYGDKWTNVGKFIGNGAYKLEEFILQEKIILKKNPYYYWDQKNVQIEKVNFLVITDTAVAYSRYMANELDIVFVNTPRSLYEKAKKTYPNELYQVPRASVSYIGINHDKISDKRVRKALQLGIDREIIAKHVLGAGYRPAYNFVPPSIKHANFSKPDWSEWSDQQRYAEAKRLLAAAGYNEQNPYKFTLYYDTSETGKFSCRCAIYV